MLDDRLSQAVASIVAAFTSHTRFFGLYEFEVVSAEFEKLSATPTDSKLGLPQLKDVPLLSPSSGARAKLDAGAKVLIAFVNGSPSRPVVLSTNANKPALEVTLECVTSLSIDAPSVEINASGSVKVNSSSIELGGSGGQAVAHSQPIVTAIQQVHAVLTAMSALPPPPLTGSALSAAIAVPYAALTSSGIPGLAAAPSTTTKAV